MKTANELKQLLQTIDRLDHDLLIDCQNDSRKTVQALAKSCVNRIEKEQRLARKFQEMSEIEAQLRSESAWVIAGVDEAGRGPLAGPVVAGAVVLPADFYLLGLNDSKQLSEKKRDEFYNYIQAHALAVGVGIVEADEIDRINIYEATKVAMMKAIASLSNEPTYLLIDAMKLPVETAQMSLIKGDARSISIAAASVIAKVTRDRLMRTYAAAFPAYRFERNMGYGTRDHFEAIEQYGATPIHRMSFYPLSELT